MSYRYKMRDLENLVARINAVAGTPEKPYREIQAPNAGTASFKANVGNYHLDGAYGGHRLVQMCNDGGGIRTITSGYVSKSKLYDEMQAFCKGLEVAKEKVA